MSNSPVTPSDALDAVPDANAKACRKMALANLKFPALFAQFLDWMLNTDGSISDEFKAAMGVPSGEVPVTTPIAPPAAISATDGAHPDKVTITWSPVSNAVAYEVFRSVLLDYGTAVSLGNPTASPFDDVTAVVGQTYFYWVRAKDAGGKVSSPSIHDSGFAKEAGAGGSGTVGVQSISTSQEWTVPEGITLLWAKLWGPGGGGGSGTAPGLVPPGTSVTVFGGGGGGSGQFVHVGSIAVTPGEKLIITVGPGGGGSNNTSPGGVGITSQLARATSVVIASAGAGGGGGFGGNLASVGGIGGTGGGVTVGQGTQLANVSGTAGSPGSSGPYTTAPPGGAGAPENNGGGNSGGQGGAGYASGGQSGGPGTITLFK